MKHKFQVIVSKITMTLLASITLLSSMAPSAVYALNFDDIEWRTTTARIGATTYANHTFSIDLATSKDWDITTYNDEIIIDFPSTFAMSATSTWQAADFSIYDGATSTLPNAGGNAVTATTTGNITTSNTAGAIPTYTCSTDEYAVYVNTADGKFGFKRCATTQAATAGANIVVTIYGDATTGNGTIGNPVAAGSVFAEVSMKDENQANAYLDQVATGFIAYDTITESAVLPTAASLVFSLNVETSTGASTYSACSSTTQSEVGAVTFPNPLLTGSINVALKSICTNLTTNAGGGTIVNASNTLTSATATVYVVSTNGRLTDGGSNQIPDSVITTPSESATTIAAGTESYTLCTASTGTNATTAGVTAIAPYNGICTNDPATASNTSGGTLGTTFNDVWYTTSTAEAYAHLWLKIAIDPTNTAAATYSDTLTFVAAGTF